MAFPILGKTVARDFETDGVPASGAHKILKADMRAWMASVEASLGLGGDPWFDVAQFTGVDPTGAIDSSVGFQAALNAASALAGVGGATVYAGPGLFLLLSGVTVPANVRLIGSGQNSTFLIAWHTDVTVVTVSGSRSALENLTVFGKGLNNDTGALGATQNALVVSGVECSIRNVVTEGGYYALLCSGTDCLFENVNANQSYGPANVAITGANWCVRCKFDHSPTGIGATTALPFPAWAATTGYTVGKIVTTGGYAIQCSSAGTSGGSAPTVKNYGIVIQDGTAQWLLLAPSVYAGLLVSGAGAGENHLTQIDLSSIGYSQSLTVNAANAVVTMSDSVLSSPILLTTYNVVCLRGCENAGNIAVNGGNKTLINSLFAIGGSWSIAVAAAVSNFLISDNHLGAAGTITVATGASDHYTIVNNVGVTVTDNGTGTHKTVSGNIT